MLCAMLPTLSYDCPDFIIHHLRHEPMQTQHYPDGALAGLHITNQWTSRSYNSQTALVRYSVDLTTFPLESMDITITYPSALASEWT